MFTKKLSIDKCLAQGTCKASAVLNSPVFRLIQSEREMRSMSNIVIGPTDKLISTDFRLCSHAIQRIHLVKIKEACSSCFILTALDKWLEY